MPEAREKARALLAEVKAGSVPLRDAADATKALVQSLGLLAALCDENDALRAELAKVTAAHAFQSSEVNGLTAEVDCMEHEDSQLRAEVERLRAEADATMVERDVADRECDRLRAQADADRQELTRMDAEVKRLKAIPPALCFCVGATYSFDPGRNVIGQRAGYTITAGVGCPACRGRGVVVGGDAE